MKKASIRDLHMRTGALVQDAADGEVIVVEKRGLAIAELVPLQTLTTAEVFRERQRSGYFKKLRKTDSKIDRYISEGR
jgi:antitoxin (DNA-binding transcriptional repressor) of toxin-antitoxin stability system